MTGERPLREGDEVASEGLGRLLALADGVFAIALTLLVIEITLPEGTSDARLGAALVTVGPHYFAYVLSFAVIARFWIAHHNTFRYIGGYDDPLIWLNFLLLLFVAFLPFPTSVLGEHGDTPTGATFYGAVLACTSAASGVLLWYASGPGHLLRPDVDHRQVRRSRISSLAGTVYFVATLPVALLAPYVAMGLWLLWFPVVRVLVNRQARRR
ncbi:MAG TPA: TMEM175 family protein [Actinomycetes bacterium]